MTRRTRTALAPPSPGPQPQATAAGTFAPALPKGARASLFNDQAVYEFVGWLTRFPDPDEVLRKAGLTRASLRALESDDEIAQCLDTRREALIATPWRLEPQQSRASKWLAEEIAPHIDDLLGSAFNAVLYGYSVCEVVYAKKGPRIGIAHLCEKPLEWFEPRHDGSLIYYPQIGAEVACDPIKYILSRYRPSYRQPYGESLLSRLYWAAFFRSHGRKFWAKFLERFGEPLLIGKVRDQAKFIDDMLALGIGAGLPIGQDDSIEHVAVTQAGEFERFENAMSKSIQKLILGQTLTSDVGNGGSYAAAKVHESVKETKRNADIRMVAMACQALINNLCALNGISAPPEFIMADDTGLEIERAGRDAQLVDAGILKLTPAYLLDRYDFREGDFEIVEAAPPPPAGPDPQAEADDDEDPEAPEAAGQTAATMAAPLTLSDQRPRFTAGQQAIEDQIDASLKNFTSPIQHKAIASAIAGATSAENLIERLGVAMQDADDSQFRQTLERALFAADLMGYGQAQAASGAGQGAAAQAAAPATIHLSAPITIQMPEQQAAIVNMAPAPAPPAPVVQVDVHVPEQSAPVVNLAAPAITVQPAPVTVNNAFASQAVQTVQRDENDEIVSTTTHYTP